MRKLLTALTSLRLEYYSSDDGYEHNAAAACEAWSSLQCLKGLHLGGQVVTVDLLQQLGSLTSLTLLGLSLAGVVDLDDQTRTANILAGALRQCTNLQQLRLGGSFYLTSPAGAAEFYGAVAGLPQLCGLSLQMGEDGIGPFGEVADVIVLQLAAATTPTSLHLGGLNLSSFALVQLCCGLTGLYALDPGDISNMTDDHLAVVAAMLQKLTALRLFGLSVTDRGVEQLSKLTQLEVLHGDAERVSIETWHRAIQCLWIDQCVTSAHSTWKQDIRPTFMKKTELTCKQAAVIRRSSTLHSLCCICNTGSVQA